MVSKSFLLALTVLCYCGEGNAYVSNQTMKAIVQTAAGHFPSILASLNKYNEKRGHWIWYVMPTTKPGNSQPSSEQAIYVPRGQEQLWMDLLKNKLILGYKYSGK